MADFAAPEATKKRPGEEAIRQFGAVAAQMYTNITGKEPSKINLDDLKDLKLPKSQSEILLRVNASMTAAQATAAPVAAAPTTATTTSPPAPAAPLEAPQAQQATSPAQATGNAVVVEQLTGQLNSLRAELKSATTPEDTRAFLNQQIDAAEQLMKTLVNGGRQQDAENLTNAVNLYVKSMLVLSPDLTALNELITVLNDIQQALPKLEGHRDYAKYQQDATDAIIGLVDKLADNNLLMYKTKDGKEHHFNPDDKISAKSDASGKLEFTVQRKGAAQGESARLFTSIYSKDGKTTFDPLVFVVPKSGNDNNYLSVTASNLQKVLVAADTQRTQQKDACKKAYFEYMQELPNGSAANQLQVLSDQNSKTKSVAATAAGLFTVSGELAGTEALVNQMAGIVSANNKTINGTTKTNWSDAIRNPEMELSKQPKHVQDFFNKTQSLLKEKDPVKFEAQLQAELSKLSDDQLVDVISYMSRYDSLHQLPKDQERRFDHALDTATMEFYTRLYAIIPSEVKAGERKWYEAGTIPPKMKQMLQKLDVPAADAVLGNIDQYKKAGIAHQAVRDKTERFALAPDNPIFLAALNTEFTQINELIPKETKKWLNSVLDSLADSQSVDRASLKSLIAYVDLAKDGLKEGHLGFRSKPAIKEISGKLDKAEKNFTDAQGDSTASSAYAEGAVLFRLGLNPSESSGRATKAITESNNGVQNKHAGAKVASEVKTDVRACQQFEQKRQQYLLDLDSALSKLDAGIEASRKDSQYVKSAGGKARLNENEAANSGASPNLTNSRNDVVALENFTVSQARDSQAGKKPPAFSEADRALTGAAAASNTIDRNNQQLVQEKQDVREQAAYDKWQKGPVWKEFTRIADSGTPEEAVRFIEGFTGDDRKFMDHYIKLASVSGEANLWAKFQAKRSKYEGHPADIGLVAAVLPAHGRVSEDWIRASKATTYFTLPIIGQVWGSAVDFANTNLNPLVMAEGMAQMVGEVRKKGAGPLFKAMIADFKKRGIEAPELPGLYMAYLDRIGDLTNTVQRKYGEYDKMSDGALRQEYESRTGVLAPAHYNHEDLVVSCIRTDKEVLGARDGVGEAFTKFVTNYFNSAQLAMDAAYLIIGGFEGGKAMLKLTKRVGAVTEHVVETIGREGVAGTKTLAKEAAAVTIRGLKHTVTAPIDAVRNLYAFGKDFVSEVRELRGAELWSYLKQTRVTWREYRATPGRVAEQAMARDIDSMARELSASPEFSSIKDNLMASDNWKSASLAERHEMIGTLTYQKRVYSGEIRVSPGEVTSVRPEGPIDFGRDMNGRTAREMAESGGAKFSYEGNEVVITASNGNSIRFDTRRPSNQSEFGATLWDRESNSFKRVSANGMKEKGYVREAGDWKLTRREERVAAKPEAEVTPIEGPAMPEKKAAAEPAPAEKPARVEQPPVEKKAGPPETQAGERTVSRLTDENANDFISAIERGETTINGKPINATEARDALGRVTDPAKKKALAAKWEENLMGGAEKPAAPKVEAGVEKGPVIRKEPKTFISDDVKKNARDKLKERGYSDEQIDGVTSEDGIHQDGILDRAEKQSVYDIDEKTGKFKTDENGNPIPCE